MLSLASTKPQALTIVHNWWYIYTLPYMHNLKLPVICNWSNNYLHSSLPVQFHKLWVMIYKTGDTFILSLADTTLQLQSNNTPLIIQHSLLCQHSSISLGWCTTLITHFDSPLLAQFQKLWMVCNWSYMYTPHWWRKHKAIHNSGLPMMQTFVCLWCTTAEIYPLQVCPMHGVTF